MLAYLGLRRSYSIAGVLAVHVVVPVLLLHPGFGYVLGNNFACDKVPTDSTTVRFGYYQHQLHWIGSTNTAFTAPAVNQLLRAWLTPAFI